MSDDRTFKINTAHAKSEHEFAIGLNAFPMDMEDSHTAYLIYDARLEQPWSRVDANRNSSDITSDDNNYYALSSEEYVHVLNGTVGISEEIKGMGIHADNATEGAGLAIANIANIIFIAGQKRQFYKRNESGIWPEIFINISTLDKIDISFEALGGSAENDIILSGRTAPNIGRTSEELRNARSKAIASGDKKKQREIRKLIRAGRTKPEGRAYHWDGSTWTQIDVEDYFPRTVFFDSQGRAWLGCDRGTILQVERDEDGDFDVDDIEIIEESRAVISSITEFKGRLIMASTEGLHAYNEDFDSIDDEIVQIKPKLNKKLHSKPSPLKVQAVDDVMYYFDYNLGIYIWDGDKTWTNIPIPPELLERDFKG